MNSCVMPQLFIRKIKPAAYGGGVEHQAAPHLGLGSMELRDHLAAGVRDEDCMVVI